jgi:hypothetical protein
MLIRELLRAGYIEDWKYNKTYSGTPQGGVLSPLLSNIYLDRLDKYVEATLIPEFTKGQRRVESKEYRKIRTRMNAAKRNADEKEWKDLEKQQRKMPSQDPNDPNYKRLRYIRYADDFLLGVIGAKAEAEEIKRKIGTFLNSELKLTMSQEKTLVTNATQETAKFLGYDIVNQQVNSKYTRNRRSVNGRIGLRVPKNITDEKGAKFLQNGKPIHLNYLLETSDFSIITEYQMELKGIVQYYTLAYNVSQLTRLKYIMQTSLVKTLAAKYKTSVKRIYGKYASTVTSENGKVLKCLQTKVEREGKKPLVATFGGFSLKRKPNARVDDKLPKPINSRTEILQRLLANVCEICGSSDNVEVHHIRKMSNLEKQGEDLQTGWKAMMAKRRRKTLVVCKKCHTAIHSGKPINSHEESLESRILGNL